MALAETLADLYSTQGDMRRILGDAGVDVSLITFSGKAINDWDSALRETERQDKWFSLLRAALREYGTVSGLWNALQERVKEHAQNELASPLPGEIETDEEMPPERGAYNSPSEYVTYREHSRAIQEIRSEITAAERRIMDTLEQRTEERRMELEKTRHDLRGEFAPTILKVALLSHMADRRMIAQSIVTGLVILLGMAAMMWFR